MDSRVVRTRPSGSLSSIAGYLKKEKTVHRRMESLLAVLAITGFALFAGANANAADAPLPESMNITCHSAEGLSKTQRAFCGLWGPGQWAGKLSHILVVEEISDDGAARVIYSHGTYRGWNIREPKYARRTGTIAGNTLTLKFPRGVTVSYTLEGGSLKGMYNIPGTGSSEITLDRAKDAQ